MKWFSNLSVRGKIYSIFGFILLVFTAINYYTYTQIAGIWENQKGLYEDSYLEIENLVFIQADLDDVMSALNASLKSGNPTDVNTISVKLDEQINEMSQSVQKMLTLNQASNHADDIKDITALKASIDNFIKVISTQILPMLKTKNLGVARDIVDGDLITSYNVIRNKIFELHKQFTSNTSELMSISKKEYDTSVNLLIIITLLMCVISVAFIVAIIGTLKKIIKEITETVSVLGSSASEISASTSELAASSTETATAVSETTTTVEEIRQTASISNQKAKQVAESSQRAVQVSQTGRQSTNETVEGINKIGTQMESIAESIIKLSEQSRAIAEIIASVNDLAEQTNLLSVNASIEAAKAGEQGKGFAVVAQEIKNLADQSKQATTQVRTILNDIQNAISGAVMSTEQGNKAVDSTIIQSGQTAAAIETLSRTIEEAAQAAVQIAASSQQQSVGMDQTVRAMENIKLASTQNASTTKQLESASHILKDMGQKLQQLMHQFKV